MGIDMSDKIQVQIIGQKVVKYKQTVEMTQEQYDAINEKLESDERKVSNRAVEEIEGLLDLRDVSDWDDFELDDFSVVTE